MINIECLLPSLDAFIGTMYAVSDSFGFSTPPDVKHIGTCINYNDLQEMRDKFIEELTNTVITYVYSPSAQQRIREALLAGRDESAAWVELYRRVRKKFRPSSLQGQFSELLLCNLLQYYYRAAPLVRKMPLTTNPALERNGADAIHIARHGDAYRLYLGEAKTYNRKHSGLRPALGDAVHDVLEKYASHIKGLDLYTYEDFVPAELENIARQYLSGSLQHVEVHLICIATYDEKKPVTGKSKQEKLDCIIDTLRAEAKQAASATAITKIPAELLPRMNFIMFPVQALDNLIKSFESVLS